MDIYSVLKQDHRKFEKLLEKLEQTTERAVKTRTELFAELQRTVTAHSEAESEVFYTKLEQEGLPDKVMMPEAHAEHQTVKHLMDELATLEVDSLEWSGKFLVLKENLEHHIKEEEKEVFKAARKVLESDIEEQLAEDMREREQQYLEHPPANAVPQGFEDQTMPAQIAHPPVKHTSEDPRTVEPLKPRR